MTRIDEDPQRDARWLAQVAAGKAGARQALDGLRDAYEPVFLRQLLRKALPVQEADDVLQETWIRVARRAPTFDPQRAHAAAWLWTIFKGVSADAFKALSEQASAEVTADELDDLPGDDALRPEALDVMLRNCVRRAMARLRRADPEGADLLWLRAAEEWKPEELAAVDGRVVGTIKNILSRVRKLAEDALRPCQEGRATPPMNRPPHAAP